MGHPDRAVRPPPLANEIILTHQEVIEVEQPKRLKMKDAGIQKSEEKYQSKGRSVQTDNEDDRRLRGYKSTDVSTATEVTPLKTRPVQEAPPMIQEEPIVKKKVAKKKPVKKSPKP